MTEKGISRKRSARAPPGHRASIAREAQRGRAEFTNAPAPRSKRKRTVGGGGDRAYHQFTHAKTRLAKHAKRNAASRLERPLHQVRTPLTELVIEKTGNGLVRLAKETGLRIAMLSRMGSGELAPNHPAVVVVAKHLNVPVDQIAAMQHGAMLEGGYLDAALRKITKQVKKGRNGTAPGTAVVVASKPREPMRCNKLRGKPERFKLRESVRSIITTLNMAIMSGEPTIAPLPVEVAHALIADYLERAGLKPEYVLPPDSRRRSTQSDTHLLRRALQAGGRAAMPFMRREWQPGRECRWTAVLRPWRCHRRF
jgi:hypothetical protein